MAGLVAWLITIGFMACWVVMSSPVWLAFSIFGWKKEAKTVAAGPMKPLQRSLQQACGAIHCALWERLGWWVLAVYAAIILVLAVIGPR